MFRKTRKLILIAGLLLLIVTLSGVPYLSAAEKKHRVMIDPAHGGPDAGIKITDKVGEKDITLAIALAVQKELAKDSNLEVVLTRNADKEMNVEERRKNIAKIKPDAFISIHINAGFGKNATGFEIYYPGFKDTSDQKKQVKDGQKDAKNKYLNDSVRLAQIIQKNLDNLFPRKGRGLREAETPVLEGINLPAVVVEIGFGTNPEERKKLLSVTGQAEIAKTLARSIKSFY